MLLLNQTMRNVLYSSCNLKLGFCLFLVLNYQLHTLCMIKYLIRNIVTSFSTYQLLNPMSSFPVSLLFGMFLFLLFFLPYFFFIYFWTDEFSLVDNQLNIVGFVIAGEISWLKLKASPWHVASWDSRHTHLPPKPLTMLKLNLWFTRTNCFAEWFMLRLCFSLYYACIIQSWISINNIGHLLMIGKLWLSAFIPTFVRCYLCTWYAICLLMEKITLLALVSFMWTVTDMCFLAHKKH